MRKCRPFQWLPKIIPWAVPGVLLPLLAAGVISTQYMKSDVAGRARAALDAGDATKWANVQMDGRTATISGKTTNEMALDEVVKVVSGTNGVRKVVNAARYEPLKLVAPTIESLKSDMPIAEIKGTWPEGVAKVLIVTAAGTSYVLGTNPELTTDSGNWLLKLASPLRQGTYEVTASASVDSDGATVTQAAEVPARIVVEP